MENKEIVKSAGGVVLNSEGKIALVSQKGEYWSLPKGRIRAGEDARSAARREVYEETGLKNIEFIKNLGSYQREGMDYSSGAPEETLKELTYFLFKTDETELRPIDPDNPEAKWITIDEGVELMRHEEDKNFLKKILGDLNI